MAKKAVKRAKVAVVAAEGVVRSTVHVAPPRQARLGERPTVFAPRAVNMPRPRMTPTAGTTGPQEIGAQLLNVDVAAHSRGENLAKLVEARHNAITQRKAENMQDELERIAGSRDMGQFWDRAAVLRTGMMESEQRDARTAQQLTHLTSRFRSRAGGPGEPPAPGGFMGAVGADPYAAFRTQPAPATAAGIAEAIRRRGASAEAEPAEQPAEAHRSRTPGGTARRSRTPGGTAVPPRVARGTGGPRR